MNELNYMFCVQAFPWLTQATTAGNSHATIVHWWLQVLLTISHNRPMQNVFRCFNLDRISMKLPNQGFQYLPISFSIFQYLPIVMHNNHNAACSLISSNIDPWLQTKVFTDSSQSQPSSSWLWQPVAPPDSAWGCAPALADLPDMTMAIAVGFFLRSLCKWLHMMWVGSPNHSDPLEIFTRAQTRRLRGGGSFSSSFCLSKPWRRAHARYVAQLAELQKRMDCSLWVFLLQSSEHGKHLDLTNHISLRTEWMAQVSVGHMAMALFDITPHHNRDVTTNRWQTDKQWHEPCKLHGIAQRLLSFCFSFSFGSFESFPLGVSFSFKSASSSTSQQQNNAWHSIPVSTWPLQSRPCLGSIFFVMSWNGKKRLGFLIKVTNCAILSMRKKPSKSNHWKV